MEVSNKTNNHKLIFGLLKRIIELRWIINFTPLTETYNPFKYHSEMIEKGTKHLINDPLQTMSEPEVYQKELRVFIEGKLI